MTTTSTTPTTISTQKTISRQDTIPDISVTTPTPPRSLTSTVHAPTYRLLYRGALSLPDSHLLLDGLTFSARRDNASSGYNLLQNPLALALESMRGRPSLRFLGVVKRSEVWMDESGEIGMDIHPHAVLSRIYFENIFCLAPLPSTSNAKLVLTSPPDLGIKVALGDSNGPETTEIIIFARPIHPDTASHPTLQLAVARITPHPPPQPRLLRLPRPDDPTPRKPPLFVGGEKANTRELKRVASVGGAALVNGAKRQKLERNGSGSVLADLGSGVRLGREMEDQVTFKIPDVPLRPDVKKQKGKGKQKDTDVDVFGDTAANVREDVVIGNVVENKGKRKFDDQIEEVDLERTNKNKIKKATQNYFASKKNPTSAAPILEKSHPEFRELFGWVYRGVTFAMRSQMNSTPVDPDMVDRLIKMHASMYLSGMGIMASN